MDQPAPDTKNRRISIALLALWTLILVGVFGWVGDATIGGQRAATQEAISSHAERMDPAAPESGLTEADIPAPAGAVPVHAGIYVDRIVALSLPEVSWTVDFYLWFRWEGAADLDPGASFQVIDGWIDSKELADSYSSDSPESSAENSAGGTHYQIYRVVATITKSFNVTRFPMDDHLLTINIESTAHKRDALVFVPDTASAGISSRVKVPGYAVGRTDAAALIEKPHAYKTTRVDPRLPAGTRSVHSQLRCGIHLIREGWGYFFKMFEALYISVAIAMTIFFIKPSEFDPRVGLAVGALFAAVANAYVTSTLIPQSGAATLTDIVNGLGALTIFLTICHSTISLYVANLGEEELAIKFDRFIVVIFVVAYGYINWMLPSVASLG